MKRLFLFLVVLVFFIPVVVRASGDHLVLSQIQTTGGAGLTTNDFIEIFNPTSQDIDLNGYRLVKRTQAGITDTLIKSWTDSTIITAGGYYLWANSAFTNITAAPDTTTTGSIADDNGVALRLGASDTGTIIDSVAWGKSTNAFIEGAVYPTNPAANLALTRTQDTDNNSVDFSIQQSNPHKSLYVAPVVTTDPTPPPPPPSTDPSPSPDPSPNPAPVSPPPPNPLPTPSPTGSSQPSYSKGIIISEFLPNPDGADSGSEWVELYNNSTLDVDLGGWILDDEGKPGVVGSSAYTIPSPSVIKASGYLVVDLPDGVFALDNTGGDSIRLIWPNKQVEAEVDYTDSAPIDTSYARKPDGTYAWTTILTKGVANQIQAPQADASEPKSDATTSETPDASVPDNSAKLVISELFPDPSRKSSQEEFIELYNPNDTDVDLTGYKIADLVTSYKLSGLIPAQTYLTIMKSDSNISLNNSGTETVTLTDLAGDEVDAVTYTDAPTEQSYNLMPDGSFQWSSALTPGLPNKIAATKVPAKTIAAAASITGQISAANSATQASDANALENAPEIAGASINQSAVATPAQISVWPWLVASFALNLLFSYLLVKLMARKGSI